MSPTTEFTGHFEVTIAAESWLLSDRGLPNVTSKINFQKNEKTADSIIEINELSELRRFYDYVVFQNEITLSQLRARANEFLKMACF